MQFDPFSPEVIADPHPFYQRLIADSPVHHDTEHDVWVLSRYDDVRDAARRPDVLSSVDGVAYHRFPLPMMLTIDPPDHTRLRRLVARDFTPRAVESWRPLVDRLVGSMFSEMLSSGEADLVPSLAAPLPIAVIAEILGVPEDDRAEFKGWSDDVVEGFAMIDQNDLVEGEMPRVLSGVVQLQAYFTELLASRRTEPRDDLVSKLLVPHERDELSDNELFWICFLLLVAGNETTTNLLGNLFLALHDHPDQWQLLKSRPDLVPSAVEEALRFGAPVQGFFRTALAPYAVGDVEIPAGARVLLLFAAANRDPSRYPEPDRFVVERNPVDHLAFGAGIHHYLGAGLARLEISTVLCHLLERVDGFEVTGEVVRTSNPALRGVARLPLRLREGRYLGA